MDLLLRAIAIIIEVVILGAIAYAIMKGVRLTVLDLGIKPKYDKAIVIALFVIGAILMIFFIAHLTTFYPEVL